MNKEMLKLIIKYIEITKDYTEFFPAILEDINNLIKHTDSINFLNDSKEMEVWEKISNAQISSNPKSVYPKDIFLQDIIELSKN